MEDTAPQVEDIDTKPPQSTGEKTRNPIMFKTEDTVDSAVLEKLGTSEAIKTLLRNPHLRNFLKEVDDSDKPWKAMKAAMQEPLFLEFADECLAIVEPTESNKS